MATPRSFIISGYGINCEKETAFAFEQAGARANIVHINNLIAGHVRLAEYQILVFPGGFSYGDDTGSGKAFANRVRNHLWEEVRRFVEEDHLTLGICNGFQILTQLGLLPGKKGTYGERSVALIHNDSARYINRWVDLAFRGRGPWGEGIETISLPIAHGEGKLYAPPETIEELKQKNLITLQYVAGDVCAYQQLPANPNGSLENIAGITDETGRVLGMMPHPERAVHFTQLPHWTLLRETYTRAGREIPTEGPGLQIFRNAVAYFK